MSIRQYEHSNLRHKLTLIDHLIYRADN